MDNQQEGAVNSMESRDGGALCSSNDGEELSRASDPKMMTIINPARECLEPTSGTRADNSKEIEMNEESIKTVGTPAMSAAPRSAAEIAESVLGNIAWKSQFEGYCDCPGKIKHTTRDAEKDCHVYLDKVPTVFCFHRRCRVAIKLANERLRGDIMDAEIEKLLIERRGKKDAAPKLGLVATVDGVGKGTQSGSCLQKGKDRGGQHLVVFQDGRFGCAANPGDSDHRKQIYRLCGVGGVFTPRAIPIRVKKSLRGAGGRYGR